jgi:predicted amidohydrolase
LVPLKEKSRREKALASLEASKGTGGAATAKGTALGDRTFDQKKNAVGSEAYMARNTAYLFYEGQELCRYHKNGDFHEVTHGMDTVFIPGGKPGSFPIQKAKFGFEICFDNNLKVLKTTVPSADRPHVHIIMSAYVEGKEETVAAQPGGYVIHACAKEQYTRVTQVGNTQGMANSSGVVIRSKNLDRPATKDGDLRVFNGVLLYL